MVVVVVLVLFLTGVISGGSPQPKSVLDLIPDDADNVTRMDLDRILANDFISDAFEVEDLDELDDELGLDPDDISELTAVEWDSGNAFVIKGSFDLDLVRDELEDVDAEDNPYRGYEVWENLDGGAMALLDGYLIGSDYSVRPVENILKNLYNESGSLGQADENNEMKQILAKLGEGYIVYAVTGDSCPVQRCEGFGWALTEVDEANEEGTVQIVLLFRNERAAENAADDYDEVAAFLERQEDLNIEDTEADGKFVVGVAISEYEEEESGGVEAPAPPAAAPISRDEWIEYCYDNSAYLEITDCGCVYDYIRASISPVPAFDPNWEDDQGLPLGANAVNQCY